MTGLETAGLAGAAVAAGMVNALAGGGSLVSFPALLSVGLPALAANVTNTVALVPGYLGGGFSQVQDLKGQGQRLLWLVPAAALGGVAGALLLLQTSERLFAVLVPWLILLGSGLLAVQEPLKRWLGTLQQEHRHPLQERWVSGPVLLSALYGGYFGAGLGVIVLACLSLCLDENLTRLNGLKQVIAFVANLMAALVFLGSGQVSWGLAGLMAIGAIVGGLLGGLLAQWVNPKILRLMVVTMGVIIGLTYLHH